MKRNDLQELKTLTSKVLIEKVKTLKGELADLVIDKNMSKLKDLKVLGKKRKDIAQILTVLRQKELVEELESRVKNLESSKKEVKKEAKS